MRWTVASYAVGWQLLGLLSVWPLAAWAELPRRDFVVELRQVSESQNGADEPVTYSASPSAANGLAPQQVRVQNGEKAQLRITQSLPMQWVQSAASQNASLRAGSAHPTNRRREPGVNNGGGGPNPAAHAALVGRLAAGFGGD